MTLPPGLSAQLDTLCYMVDRGKPAALVAVQERHLRAAQELVDGYGLSWQARAISPGWSELWVYRYAHIGSVITALPAKPASAFEHWVLGKLFGYEESAIEAFLDSGERGCTALRARREGV